MRDKLDRWKFFGNSKTGTGKPVHCNHQQLYYIVQVSHLVYRYDSSRCYLVSPKMQLIVTLSKFSFLTLITWYQQLSSISNSPGIVSVIS